MSAAELLRDFAWMHIGSGKDIDDVRDDQRYGHVIGMNHRHKWGLDPGVGTPLQICVSRGGLEAARILIDAGADVNFSLPDHGFQGAPPLHLAIKTGNMEMTKMLLERGSNKKQEADMLGAGHLNAEDYARVCANKNPTPERIAISQLVDYYNMPMGAIHKPELSSFTNPIPAENPVTWVRQLIGTGRNINDIHGGLRWAQTPDRSPLAAVAGEGDVEAVRLLLAAGADVNKMDCQFGGPLHYAIKSGCIDLVKVLLDAGADKHATTNEPGALSALEYTRVRSVQNPEWMVILHLVEYHTQIWPTPFRRGQ